MHSAKEAEVLLVSGLLGCLLRKIRGVLGWLLLLLDSFHILLKDALNHVLLLVWDDVLSEAVLDVLAFLVQSFDLLQL